MRVIAVVNQKGGVGKTTTAVNLGHALLKRGYQVTLLDLDPQGHLAPCLGLHATGEIGMDKVLLGGQSLDSQTTVAREGIAVVPAGNALADFESRGTGVERAYRLRDALSAARDGKELVVLDCAPSSGMLAMNAICAADDVLMPVAGDYLSLTGLARLMLTLRRLEVMRDREMRQWVFFSRFMPRRRLAREVLAKVSTHFPDRLLRTSVQEAAALAECAGVGKTIFEYRGGSRSAREFESLADDLIHARVVGNEPQETSHVA